MCCADRLGAPPLGSVALDPWGDRDWECKNDGKGIPKHGCPRHGSGARPLPWVLLRQFPSDNGRPSINYIIMRHFVFY